jgi:hypothetical protein
MKRTTSGLRIVEQQRKEARENREFKLAFSSGSAISRKGTAENHEQTKCSARIIGISPASQAAEIGELREPRQRSR